MSEEIFEDLSVESIDQLLTLSLGLGLSII